MPSLAEVVDVLEAHAPSGTAEPWDNVGLLVGDPQWRTAATVVCVDLSPRAISAARARKARLIVTHHPCIFPKSKGISRITAGSDKTGLVFEAIRNGIGIASYHTNFDRCALEVPRTIAKSLGLVPRGRLIEKGAGSCVKLAVFVPRSHAEQVRSAIHAAGAGQIGHYDSCSFMCEGEGTFRGSSDTNPFLGKPGVLERAQEVRLETVLPRGFEGQVLKAMFQAHPYEEVAYDLYPIEQAPSRAGMVRGLGYGFWGEFDRPRPFSEVARDVRKLFKAEGFFHAKKFGKGQPSKKIKRVAFAAGKSSQEIIRCASSLRCDLMITGEAGYHEALAASMPVMELGHPVSEIFFAPTVRRWLSRAGVKGAIV